MSVLESELCHIPVPFTSKRSTKQLGSHHRASMFDKPCVVHSDPGPLRAIRRAYRGRNPMYLI